MRKQLILCCILLIFSTLTNAQNEEHATVVSFINSSTNEPLPFVSFKILNGVNKALLLNVADNNGIFILNVPINIKQNQLQLVITDTNYLPLNHSLNALKDSIIIRLKINNIKTLETVKIVARQNALKQDASGAELDITKIKEAKFWNIAEALRQIPGISVDENTGGISYMGQGIAIVKDGIKVAGFDQLIRNTLSTGKATTYNKIALNLYDLKTEQPTLSFIEGKYENGIFGNINGAFGIPNSSMFANLSFASKKHLISFSANGTRMSGAKTTSFSEALYYNAGIKIEDNFSKPSNSSANYSYSLSESYSISKQHIINISFNFSGSNNNFPYLIERSEYRQDTLYNRSSITSYIRSKPKKNNGMTGSFTYTFKPKSKAGNSQRFDISAEWKKDNSGTNTGSEVQLLKGDLLPQSNYNKQNNSTAKRFFSLIGYEFKTKKAGNFEVVGKYFIRNLDKTLLFTYNTEIAGTDSTILQQYGIGYQYAALLTSWSRSFKGFSARTVLKVDYSSDEASGNSVREKFSFSSFSPYLSLFKELKSSSLGLEIKYSQRRPTLNALSSIIDYGEQYGFNAAISKGNPALKPERELELSGLFTTNIKKIEININSSFVHSSRNILQITEVQDSVLIKTYRNLSASDILNNNFNFQIPLSKKLRATFTSVANFIHYKISDNNIENRFSWAEIVNFSYTLSKFIRLSANATYGGGTQFQTNSSTYLSTGINAVYSKKKFSLNIRLNNVHNPFNTIDFIKEGIGFTRHTYTRSRYISGSIGFSYKFGKLFKTAQQGKTIEKDDM